MEKAVTTTTAGYRPIAIFVQTDTFSFREVAPTPDQPIENGEEDAGYPSNKASPGNTKRPTASLHEMRQYTRQRLEISKPNALRFGPGIDHTGSLISPSRSSGIRSPVTGTGTSDHPDFKFLKAATPTSNFSKLSIAESRSKHLLLLNTEEEEKAMKERRLYLHPSPRSKGSRGASYQLVATKSNMSGALFYPLRSA